MFFNIHPNLIWNKTCPWKVFQLFLHSQGYNFSLVITEQKFSHRVNWNIFVWVFLDIKTQLTCITKLDCPIICSHKGSHHQRKWWCCGLWRCKPFQLQQWQNRTCQVQNSTSSTFIFYFNLKAHTITSYYLPKSKAGVVIQVDFHQNLAAFITEVDILKINLVSSIIMY